jgi:hypothetical protein
MRPGSISVECGADPGAFVREGLVEELIELLRRLGDREDAGALFLRRYGAIKTAQRDLVGKAVECGS